MNDFTEFLNIKFLNTFLDKNTHKFNLNSKSYIYNNITSRGVKKKIHTTIFSLSAAF